MTNQQGAPEALRLADELEDSLESHDGSSLTARCQGIADDAAAELRRLHAENERLAALVEAQQPAAHVQNPAEIEQVAGDVSKNGQESNMAQQPAPSAAADWPIKSVGAKAAAHVALQFGGCPECGSRSCVARECSRTVSHAAQAVPGVQWQCGQKASGFTAPQPSPTPQADSQAAPLQDESAARDECKRQWLAEDEDCTLLEAYDRGWKDRAARAPADSVTAPAGVVGPDGMMRDELRSMIEGMSVSVDVSTGDHDAGHRYFGTVTEVMDCRDDKHGVTLLVQDAEPNFAPTPPAQAADSVLEDADPIRALIAEHAAILDQNESAYFELCYHRATGWMAWITDKPLCMPPVVNPDRKVLAQGQGDTADEACRDAARKQGANHE